MENSSIKKEGSIQRQVGDELLDRLKADRARQLAMLVVAIESDDAETSQVLASKFGVPLTPEEENILVNATGYYPGGMM